jgi:TM2 domain-containing membrane protein YozV
VSVVNGAAPSPLYVPRVALINAVLGWLGIHRFYCGKIITGLLQLLTVGGLTIWSFIDLILILVGAFTDSDGRPITQWNYPPSPSTRRILPALLLNVFLGVFGVHRFYVGKIGTGLLQLFTFGGLGIWTLLDQFQIVWGTFTDRDGHRLTQWVS